MKKKFDKIQYSFMIKTLNKLSIGGMYLNIIKATYGTSLVVQWLRLHVPNAGSLGSIPGQGTRSHMPQEPTCLN